ncbi:shikimate and dehydroshikimate transport protein [Klebsiella pneumoniae]|uniref:Shikimate and dehydroshikimate transport protein n=1 Tax=Klebsiella pneumoniae TaxID=573 RepID=A0A2X3CNP3_KLEPN|nr:shikimate and dehydroshikimate transport protein [Klebsiella pneumoniae]
MTLGALVATVMIPLMGLLSDKVGRQKMYTLSVVLLGLFIVPWFLLLDTGHRLGHHAGDDRCLRHPVGAGNRGARHPVL